MNTILKIVPAQGLSWFPQTGERLTPEQELYLEKRRQINKTKYTGVGKDNKTTPKRHNYHATSEQSQGTISGIEKEGKAYLTSRLSSRYIKILNFYINTVHLKHESSVSQLRAAHECGVSLSTIKRALKKFLTLGLISWKTYDNTIKPGPPGSYIFRQRCVYKIPNFLFLKNIAFKLYTLLSALSYKSRSLYKCIAISLLFANTLSKYPRISSFSKYEPVSNRYIYKQRISTSSTPWSESITSLSPPSVTKISPRKTNLQQPTKIYGWDFMKNTPVSDILRCDVTPKLGLTRKGQIFLSAFHDGALLEGLERIKSLGKGDRDFDFRLFVNTCNNYIATHKHEATVDLNRVAELYKHYGCREDGPYYYPNPTVKQPEYIPDKFIQPSHKAYESSSPRHAEQKVMPPKRVEQPTQSKAPDFSHPLLGDLFKSVANRMGLIFNKDEDK